MKGAADKQGEQPLDATAAVDGGAMPMLKGRRGRREAFLSEMWRLLPWSKLVARLDPVFADLQRVSGGRAHLPQVLRMYCLQLWYSLADDALEDVLCDSQAMRRFVGLDVFEDSAPVVGLLPVFRQQLRASALVEWLSDEIRACVQANGQVLQVGWLEEAGLWASGSAPAQEGQSSKPDLCPAQASAVQANAGSEASDPVSPDGSGTGTFIPFVSASVVNAIAVNSLQITRRLHEFSFVYGGRSVSVFMLTARPGWWGWSYRIDGRGWWACASRAYSSEEEALELAMRAATRRIDEFGKA